MRRLPARPLYLALSGISWVFQLMAFPMLSVYYLTVAGLSPFQLAVVGAVLQATVLLGEVPTGVVADLYSRRLSVVLGTLLMGAGFALEGAVPAFGVILAAQVVRGLGQTFLSGATTAWITDELGEAPASAALLRGAQAGQAGGLLGNLLCAGLAQLYVGLPILVGGLGLLGLGAFLAVAMPETGFRPAPREQRHSWRALGATLRAGLGVVRARPALLALLAAGLFVGVSGEGVDRFWEAHFLRGYTFPALGGLQPVAWFNVLNLGAMAMSVIAVGIVTRRLGRGEPAAAERWLMGLHSAAGLLVVGLGLAGQFWLAAAAFWASILFSAATGPLAEIWLNRRLPSAVRATVLSLNGQTQALGQLAGGLLLGGLASGVSIAAAITAAGLALLPAVALFWTAARQSPVSPDPQLSNP